MKLLPIGHVASPVRANHNAVGEPSVRFQLRSATTFATPTIHLSTISSANFAQGQEVTSTMSGLPASSSFPYTFTTTLPPSRTIAVVCSLVTSNGSPATDCLNTPVIPASSNGFNALSDGVQTGIGLGAVFVGGGIILGLVVGACAQMKKRRDS